MLVCFFLSGDIDLPDDLEETGISRAYLRISLYIYRFLKKHFRRFRSEEIREYLASTTQGRDVSKEETKYFIRKISIVLIMATAGFLLAFLMCIKSGSSGLIDESGRIERNVFGEKDKEAVISAKDEDGNILGEYRVSVETRAFTDKEATALFDEAGPVLERVVLGDNSSFDNVRSDLQLVDRLEGYPFDIGWKLDNYEVMHIDGRLNREAIPEEGITVMLTAVYEYRDLSWQQDFYARVLPEELSPAERVSREIGKLVNSAVKDSAYDNYVILPGSLGDTRIFWHEKVSDNSLMLLMLTLIGAAASYILGDKELKKTMEERKKQMLFDYPQMVSQLVLYMSAGMTVRNIFEKLSAAYLRERRQGGEKRYLYEEITRTVRELSAGASEAEAYERFGLRCKMRQYTRLGTLLSQNIRKGNSEVLVLLEEESAKALEERMDKVRKAGEEAGTKLLLPMVIMLVIVMIVIMIPAYLAF